jgi:ferredoxin
MTQKPVKVSDIIEAAGEKQCPVNRSLYVTSKFLGGPMCGKCFPCSMGSFEAKLRLKNITTSMGTKEDIDSIRVIADKMLVMSMCKKGKDIAKYLLEQLDHSDFSTHLKGECTQKECISFIEYRNVKDNCIRCGKCQDACKYDAIIGQKQQSFNCCYLPFEIRQRRCTKCGECIKVCPTNAIIVVNTANESPVGA